MATNTTADPESQITLKKAVEIRDYRDCEKVQREAWGLPESELVPLHILRPLCEKGGLVLNAYDKDGRPVGTCFGFLGKHEGKLIFYSHMTGVVPSHQSKGVGLRLKLSQRQYALEQGFDLMTWTYDPTQSLNNWFNLNKLGTIVRRYYVNYYDELPDNLNVGVPTDRFFAEWWLLSRRVTDKIGLRKIAREQIDSSWPIVNPTKIVGSGLRVPTGTSNLNLGEETILVEIPYDYNRLRVHDSSILQVWREETRHAYQHYFGLGYIATSAIVEESENPRSFVKLERRPLERILQS